MGMPKRGLHTIYLFLYMLERSRCRLHVAKPVCYKELKSRSVKHSREKYLVSHLQVRAHQAPILVISHKNSLTCRKHAGSDNSWQGNRG